MDVSLKGGHAPKSARVQRADELLQELRAKKAKNARKWNGAVGKRQLRWLERTLADADHKKQQVIVLCHFPLLAAASSEVHLLWNHDAVLRVLEAHPCVVAWFNGHDHAGGYAERRGIHHVTFSGMVETPRKTAWAIVDVFEDRLKIRGFGRQTSRRLLLRKG
jgi:hypothetical protein